MLAVGLGRRGIADQYRSSAFHHRPGNRAAEHLFRLGQRLTAEVPCCSGSELSGIADDYESPIGPQSFDQGVEKPREKFAVLTFLQKSSRHSIEKTQVFGWWIIWIKRHAKSFTGEYSTIW